MSEEVRLTRVDSSEPYPDRRENRVAWELHRAVVDKLDTDDGAQIIEQALNQAGVMKARQRSPIAVGWMERWEELLRGDREDLKRTMLEIGTEGEDLRQMSPFLGALTSEERLAAIRRATSLVEEVDE